VTVRGYFLGADWSRQSTYANALEDLTGYIDDAELVASWGRDTGRATSSSTAATFQFSLVNNKIGAERYFSPENTASPIAGKIWPGTPILWQKTLSGATTTMFDGELDSIEIDPDDPAQTFTGQALDAWGKPGAEKLSTPLYTGIRTGEAIAVILDAIGWTGPRELDPGATVIPYWWEDGTDAATAVQKLVDSEGPPAIAFVQGGTFVFHDRHHRVLTTAASTSQGTFSVAIPGPSTPGTFKIRDKTFTYDHGVKALANSVVFEVDQRKPAEPARIWETEDTFSLGVGEAYTIDIKPSDPFVNAVAPVENQEYTLLSGAVTPTLSRTSGQSLVLTLTAGGTGAVVQGMAVVASLIPVARTVKVSDEVPGLNPRDRVTWAGTAPWANIYDAKVLAQRIVAIYSKNRPLVTFEIENLDDTYLAQILARKVSDRITIRNDKLGLNADFIIERITHTVQAKFQVHRVRFHCQVVDPAQPVNVLTFDVAGKGFNDGAFGINGIDAASTMFRFDVAGKGFDDARFAN
jgi:hypothetical protein